MKNFWGVLFFLKIELFASFVFAKEYERPAFVPPSVKTVESKVCEEFAPYSFGPIDTFDASNSDTKLSLHMDGVGNNSQFFPNEGFSQDVPICADSALDLANLIRKSDQATTNCSNSSEYHTNKKGETVVKEGSTLTRSTVLNSNSDLDNKTAFRSPYRTVFYVCKKENQNPCITGIKLVSNGSDPSLPNLIPDWQTPIKGQYIRRTGSSLSNAESVK